MIYNFSDRTNSDQKLVNLAKKFYPDLLANQYFLFLRIVSTSLKFFKKL